MIVEQVLAPDPPISSCLCIIYTNRELAAVRLGLRLNPLPLFILELAGVSSLLLVMDALEIYSDNLAFVSLHGLDDEGKAFCKGLVLKLDESCFSRVCEFVLGGGTTMGRWKSSYSCIELCAELRSHGFTSSLSKDRFYC
jgi:hypothetical protein